MRATRFGVATAVVVVLLAGTSVAHAQVSLTLAGALNAFPAPTVTDYDAGLVTNPAGITFTVNVTGGGVAKDRLTTVSIRSSSVDLGGGKQLSDLQWRRADLPGWNFMTMMDAPIESQTVRRNGPNDPWSNSVLFKIVLSWTNDPPGLYSANLVFTLTVTTP